MTIESLKERGLLAETTDDEAARKLLSKPTKIYAGFDATASSLHVGHLVPLILLKELQKEGHTVTPLIGITTATIGDPSGKSEERNEQTMEEVEERVPSIASQVKGILGVEATANNWFENMPLMWFLRIVGKHFRASQMILEEPARTRIAKGKGISYIEFSYKLFQAYDFLTMWEMGYPVQVGGVDQRGNIIAGTQLIRKIHKVSAVGLLTPLLLDSKGTKIGKTAKGETVWLDPDLTSPFDFYQFWVRHPDDLTKKFLRMLVGGENLPEGKEGRTLLAYEMTKLVHGEWYAKKSQGKTEEMYTLKIPPADSTVKIPPGVVSVADLFLEVGLVSSKGKAKRLAKQKGLRVEGKIVENANQEVIIERDFTVMLQVGKRKVVWVTGG